MTYSIFAIQRNGTHMLSLRTCLHGVARIYMRQARYVVIAGLEDCQMALPLGTVSTVKAQSPAVTVDQPRLSALAA